MLSTTAEYALRALLSLASEPDKATLGRDLAVSSGVPANYLSKILLDLKKGGFVQAVRGTGGGYRLGRPADEVRLMDVVEFVDGTAARPGCFLAGSDACSDDDPCLAHDRWGAVRGTGGGYRLGRPPEDVRLMDVVEFVDGSAARPGCFLAGSDACSDGDPCLAHDRWAEVRDHYVAFLESTTLADVSEHPHRNHFLKATEPGSTPR